MLRKRLEFVAKLLISVGILAGLYWKLLGRRGSAELWQRLQHLSWGWLVFGYAMQLVAVAFSVLRWQRLLIGQGIHAPLRHLVGSFMIGRFFGEFAPGGWTGLNGYRLYDIAHHTGKLARATASIGIEMVLGWLSFGAVVVGGSFFGLRFIGWRGVLWVDGFFLAVIALALTLLSKPGLVRALAARAPAAISGILNTTVEAIGAYEGKSGLIVQAALLGIGVHFSRAFIYVAAARALAAELSVGDVFFGSSLQVFATLLPASINGVGLREATAVALYTRVGVPASTAVLIPTLGFLLELSLSSLGGIVFMVRRVGYSVEIRIDEPEREERLNRALPPVPAGAWPHPLRGLSIGLGAGLLAGALIGLGEALLIVRAGATPRDLSVLWYGAAAYALALGALGAGLGFLAAVSGKLLQRPALPEASSYARFCAGLVAASGLTIGAFRLRRDVFGEELAWASPLGLAVLAGCALGAVVVYVALRFGLDRASDGRGGRFLINPLGSLALVLGLVLTLMAAGAVQHQRAAANAKTARPRPPPPSAASNLILIVVDTLRADHLPSYGYGAIQTPALDRFARDAVRFESAFANASWTRPSFASILSGRFPSSHRTIGKSDALPDSLTTLPEALRDGGYTTLGVVTNFNIAPFFNFQQGFDRYTYLEPDFVLGANDSAAKLLLVQALRQAIESYRSTRGTVPVGSAYQDAQTVNRAVLGELDRRPASPFFLFVAYMDPHDPYYPHPYDGTAYARAAHPRPAPSEAANLIRLYDGEISYWDEQFGALITELQRRGSYDSSAIVVTSDHGEEFQEHGGYWHGTTLYDEALHVPLFVKLPQNRQAGSVATQLVQSIDLMPTLLGLAGVPVPAGVQGHELFRDNPSVFAEESLEGNVLKALRLKRAGSQVKLISANPDNPRGRKPFELYRVDQDPSEKVDLASGEPDLLEFTRDALRDQAAGAARGRATARKVDVDVDTRNVERLRALGYAGGDQSKSD
jgi:arylsulfatase A-like enzyme/uncharacterized membrane protein YbhN (UPF0104 family)